jgi:cystathionine beta-lyase/cystathionine gamma-synthase
VLHPLGGYLLHCGLSTLPLRVEAAQRTAIELADRLAEHPLVSRVRFPGLPGADPQRLIGRQMHGPGAMLAFETTGDTYATVAALELITPAVSLGSTDTLIQHPASLTHRLMAAGDRESCGVLPNLLRLSVGLEHVDDLWADLHQALSTGVRGRQAAPSADADPEPEPALT